MSIIAYSASEKSGTPPSKELVEDILRATEFDQYRSALSVSDVHRHHPDVRCWFLTFGVDVNDDLFGRMTDRPVQEIERLGRRLYTHLLQRGVNLFPDVYITQVIQLDGAAFERQVALEFAARAVRPRPQDSPPKQTLRL